MPARPWPTRIVREPCWRAFSATLWSSHRPRRDALHGSPDGRRGFLMNKAACLSENTKGRTDLPQLGVRIQATKLETAPLFAAICDARLWLFFSGSPFASCRPPCRRVPSISGFDRFITKLGKRGKSTLRRARLAGANENPGRGAGFRRSRIAGSISATAGSRAVTRAAAFGGCEQVEKVLSPGYRVLPQRRALRRRHAAFGVAKLCCIISVAFVLCTGVFATPERRLPC